VILEDGARGTILSVRVVPRSSKNVIEGVVDGLLRVRLTAPPVDGSANAALIDLISRECGVPKSRVVIIAGERSREKRILLRGIDAAQICDRLGIVEG
jgi:uncharacterized protein (TIGR00251 family)